MYLLRLLLAISTLFTLSGCQCLCEKLWIKWPCCVDGRRPPVIVTEYDDIIDFDECDPGCDKELVERRKRHLPKEYFDPYQEHYGEYRIVKGDQLEISVIGDQDTLEKTVIVAPDGKIYYLFLDGIQAEERTLSEVRAEMEKKLAEYFSNPVVAIIPKQTANQTYVILGRVNKPGVYPLSYPVRIRDAIGQAGGVYVEQYNVLSISGGRGGGLYGGGFGRFGGFGGGFGNYQAYTSTQRQFSNLNEAFLVRKGEKIDIDFEKLVYRGSDDENIFLRAGDYLYIGSGQAAKVYILGSIFSPQALPYVDHLTLIGALTAAGGWPSKGGPYAPDLHHLLILRGSLDCPRAICVDVWKILEGSARDIFLCPGDIVYVQNKPFRFGRELISLAIDAYFASFAAAFADDTASRWFPTFDH